MNTLALDLSTKSSGWAIFTNQQLETFGCITASSTDVINRIKKITTEIENLLQHHPTIQKIIVEEVRPENTQYGVGNLHTHKVLMWLQASVIFMIHDNYPTIEIEYIYPSEWRSKCGIHTGRNIKRKELKQADIDFVYKQFNLTVNDDIADAIGIGYASVNQNELEINWD